jgi:hypothetical protein
LTVGVTLLDLVLHNVISGTCSRTPRAMMAYDPDGTTDLATMVTWANDDSGQAEPARFVANAFAAKGSPVFRYRFSFVQTAIVDGGIKRQQFLAVMTPGRIQPSARMQYGLYARF